MPTDESDNERLGRLLRLLVPAPEGWVERAKRIVLGDGMAVPGADALTEHDLAALSRMLEREAEFRSWFDADPIAATEAAGMPVLAAALEHELRQLVSLAERVAADDAYRAAVEKDPARALGAAGVDPTAVEPVLEALGFSEDVLGRVPDVVAHGQQKTPLGAGFLIALLESSAAVESVRSIARGD